MSSTSEGFEGDGGKGVDLALWRPAGVAGRRLGFTNEKRLEGNREHFEQSLPGS